MSKLAETIKAMRDANIPDSQILDALCGMNLPVPSTTKTKSVAQKRNQYPEDFETFWKAYPDKTNNSKPNALAAWKELSEDDRNLALATIPAFKKFLAKPNAPSCVHAERFLRQRRFETLGIVSEPSAQQIERLTELTDSREHRFLAQVKADGGIGWERYLRGGFTVERLAGQTICVVDYDLQDFEKMAKPTADRLGCLIWYRAFYDKRKAKQ